jgi:hypothetical protein
LPHFKAPLVRLAFSVEVEVNVEDNFFVAFLSLALAGLLAWLWATESGARWALGQVPGLTLEGWKGELGSRQLFSRRLRLVTAGGTLTLDDVDLRGMHWVLRPYPGAAIGLSLESASVRRAEWKTAATSSSCVAPAASCECASAIPRLCAPWSRRTGASGEHSGLMFVSDELTAPWTLVSRRLSHTLIIPSGRIFIERGRVVLDPLPP